MRPVLVTSRTPSLAELIRTHWRKPTGELVTLIARHHPAATSAEIQAELRRQAAEALAEAEALEQFPRGHAEIIDLPDDDPRMASRAPDHDAALRELGFC